MKCLSISLILFFLSLPVASAADGRKLKLRVVAPKPVTVNSLADARAVTNVHRHVILPQTLRKGMAVRDYQEVFELLSRKQGITRIEIHGHWRPAHEPGETLDRLKNFPNLRHLVISDRLSKQDPKMWDAIREIERLETLNATIR